MAEGLWIGVGLEFCGVWPQNLDCGAEAKLWI